MKILNKIMKFTALLLVILMQFTFIPLPKAFASHPRVNLQTSDNFAVLAGSAISNTGAPTAVVGDVGLSPTGGTAITGLTCAQVTGTIYDTNGGYTGGGGSGTACLQTNAGLLTAAKTDLTTAYNDAASRTTTATVATELGGTTLTDGTYDSAAGTFGITGTLTLDGGGNANSVFIFKMASTLITASSSRVVLIGGAQACNVYWQVGSSATLGTSTNLAGNVLALTSITDNGSSVVRGRLLARNGAVTLNSSNVVVQGCAAGTAGASNTANSTSSTAGGGSSSKVCPALNNDLIVPSIIDSKRLSPSSISISWGPYQGTNTFIVQYGFENGKWIYSNNVTGFSAILNGLPSNQPIFVRVAARNDCYIGKYGDAKLVGGPSLPNTGFAPQKNTNPWYIPAGISVAILVALFLIQRKDRSSSSS